jgi:uncharacterized membrane protein YtjA (UPF0391 family)
MLNWLIIFLIIVIISGFLGFGGIVGASIFWIFRVIFTIFLVLFLVSLIMHLLK